MVTWDEIEAFALSLPEVTVSPSYHGAPALRVNKKLMGRLRGEMAEEHDEVQGAPYGEVLVVLVGDLGEKDALLADDPRVFFTTPHYDGHASVLVRLALADPQVVRELVLDAWLDRAPKRAQQAYADAGGRLP